MAQRIVKLLDSKAWKDGLCFFAIAILLFGSMLGAIWMLIVSVVSLVILIPLYIIYLSNKDKK